jgi:hypothetical protein
MKLAQDRVSEERTSEASEDATSVTSTDKVPDGVSDFEWTVAVSTILELRRGDCVTSNNFEVPMMPVTIYIRYYPKGKISSAKGTSSIDLIPSRSLSQETLRVSFYTPTWREKLGEVELVGDSSLSGACFITAKAAGKSDAMFSIRCGKVAGHLEVLYR